MDEGDGLYYVRARYYDGNSGRFISRDPNNAIGPREVNPYQYALGNPLRFLDPSGNSSVSALSARLASAKKRLKTHERTLTLGREIIVLQNPEHQARVRAMKATDTA